MDRKTLIIIIAFEIIWGITWFCYLKPNKAEGGDIVRDLSQYMTINPGESRQMQQMKQSYNTNQYLNQRDRQTQETYNNNINTLKRSFETNYNSYQPQAGNYSNNNGKGSYGY